MGGEEKHGHTAALRAPSSTEEGYKPEALRGGRRGEAENKEKVFALVRGRGKQRTPM